MKKVQKTSSKLTEKDVTNLINRMKFVFPTTEEVGKIIEEKIKFLPTKEEFFSRMDTLSGEIKARREEQDLHSEQHRNINDRLDAHDKHLKISTAI